ncbi:hypothetical protein SANTM175S_08726 [Streptomyces antimycoticus]
MSETNAAAEVAAPHRYTAALAADIEARWQDFWDAHGTYEAPNPGGDLAGDAEAVARPKKFVMDMFPYPSGAGLHVGHPLGYIATDVFARYHRMTGHNVLHTLGFDAFGLPAEQYAVQTGTHPRVSTEANIENMRRQLRRLGLGHDRRRSFATIDPDYYRWTQWIFLQIFNSWYDPEAKTARPIDTLVQQFASAERPTPDGRPWAELTESERADILGEYRLAYASDAPVNWCPGLGTVLANEEVTADGRSERGNFPVFKAKLRQWNMRITAYADRLLDDLDELDWPEAIKLQQRNWIGRSEGARVDFPVTDHADAKITIFTTRQDTLFGATYMVLAPEHGLVDEIVPDAWPEGTRDAWTGGHATPAQAIDAYRKQAAAKSDVERQAEVKEKTGVFTGAYAINPVSGEQVPVFIADYVLMGYGTGAIMAVPAHDSRDFASPSSGSPCAVRCAPPARPCRRPPRKTSRCRSRILFQRLSAHAQDLEADLKRLEQEPDKSRLAALLPDLRQRTERITHSADSLRWAVQERTQRFAHDDLDSLNREIEMEAGALRHWTAVEPEEPRTDVARPPPDAGARPETGSRPEAGARPGTGARSGPEAVREPEPPRPSLGARPQTEPQDWQKPWQQQSRRPENTA